MLLAGIQAEDLKDLPSAEMTLNHFCDQPNPPPKQFAAAMNQLADWHIKLAQDFDSARAALEKISARFPDTELSLQAAQRIAHLGGTEKSGAGVARPPADGRAGRRQKCRPAGIVGAFASGGSRPDETRRRLRETSGAASARHRGARETGGHLRRALPAAGSGRGRIEPVD